MRKRGMRERESQFGLRERERDKGANRKRIK